MPDALIRMMTRHEGRKRNDTVDEQVADIACSSLKLLEPPEAFLAITKYLSALNYKITKVGTAENVAEQIMREVTVSYERLRLACRIMARVTELVPGDTSLGSTHFELEETGR